MHDSMSVHRLLLLPRRSMRTWFHHEDGRSMSMAEVTEALLAERAQGRHWIPYGPPCAHFDDLHGCLGHFIEEGAKQ